MGTFSFFGGGGGISIGESPLQVGCQIYGVWQSLNLSRGIPQKLPSVVALMAAQDESAMGQNIGSNRTDPNQSVGVYQQISAHGWGTIPEELNVSTAAAMFFLGGHIDGRASTEGLIDVWQAHPGDDNAGRAQDTQHSGAGLAATARPTTARPRTSRPHSRCSTRSRPEAARRHDGEAGHDDRLAGSRRRRAGLAGCGAGAAAQTTPQVPTFPDLGYRYIPPQIPAGVAHGSALAVDLSNVGRMRPRPCVSPPTPRSATRAGRVGGAERDWARHRDGPGPHPSCGGGRDRHYQATVVFSHIKDCRSYRFYESATVTLNTVEGPRAWGAFLKDPCSTSGS